MSYKAGDLRLIVGPCPTPDPEYGDCEHWDEDGARVHESPMDSRGDYERRIPCAYLPHSCDQWVIGGVEEIKLLIEELQIALQLLEVSGKLDSPPEALGATESA